MLGIARNTKNTYSPAQDLKLAREILTSRCHILLWKRKDRYIAANISMRLFGWHIRFVLWIGKERPFYNGSMDSTK